MPSDNKIDKPEIASPVAETAKESTNQFATAMELPFVLVGGIVVGVLFGYFLDKWLHTKPILTLALGALGFFAGVRDVLRRLPGNNDGHKGA